MCLINEPTGVLQYFLKFEYLKLIHESSFKTSGKCWAKGGWPARRLVESFWHSRATLDSITTTTREVPSVTRTKPYLRTTHYHEHPAQNCDRAHSRTWLKLRWGSMSHFSGSTMSKVCLLNRMYTKVCTNIDLKWRVLWVYQDIIVKNVRVQSGNKPQIQKLSFLHFFRNYFILKNARYTNDVKTACQSCL